MTITPALVPDLQTTLVVAVEVSKSVWVIAAHVPGLQGTKVKQRLEPRADALLGAIARLKQRAADKGASLRAPSPPTSPATPGFGWREFSSALALRSMSSSR
jgi:hypothetical protein